MSRPRCLPHAPQSPSGSLAFDVSSIQSSVASARALFLLQGCLASRFCHSHRLSVLSAQLFQECTVDASSLFNCWLLGKKLSLCFGSLGAQVSAGS